MVGTWSPQLQYQHGVRVGLMQEGRASKGAGGSVWITDFAVMPNCTNMVLSTSSRQLLFYDLSTQIYKCHSKLYGKMSISTHRSSLFLTTRTYKFNIEQHTDCINDDDDDTVYLLYFRLALYTSLLGLL